MICTGVITHKQIDSNSFFVIRICFNDYRSIMYFKHLTYLPLIQLWAKHDNLFN